MFHPHGNKNITQRKYWETSNKIQQREHRHDLLPKHHYINTKGVLKGKGINSQGQRRENQNKTWGYGKHTKWSLIQQLGENRILSQQQDPRNGPLVIRTQNAQDFATLGISYCEVRMGLKSCKLAVCNKWLERCRFPPSLCIEGQ